MRLRDLVTVAGGGTPRKSHAEYFGGGIPWVTPKDMKTLTVCDSLITLTAAGIANSPAKVVPSESVLVVVRSGVLKHTLPVALNTVPVTVNQDMKALTPTSRLDARYLTRLLRARSAEILSWVRATTADNFPIDKLLDLPLVLPPIEEQRRIAAILDQADTLRAMRQRSMSLLDGYPGSLLLDLVASEDANRWPRVTVEEIAADRQGAIRTGPFGSQLLHSEFVDDGVAVLGIDNVTGNEFRWDERRFVSPEKYEALRRYTVHPRDVLITIMGTCGRCAMVPDNIPLAISTKHLCCITLDETRCLAEFLYASFLWQPIARTFLGRATKGAIMDGLSMGLIKQTPLVLPPIRRQSEFVEQFGAFQAQRERATCHLSQLNALFASLQARAFAGQL